MNWTARAQAIAELHFEEESQFRMIVDELTGEHVVYYWNNRPAKASMIDRDAQVETIRQECAKIGMRQVVYVEHPQRGPDEGYSCLAIFEVPPEDSLKERRKSLLRICQEVFSQPIE